MGDTRRFRAVCTGPVHSWSKLSQACALMSFWFSRSNSFSIRFFVYRRKGKYAQVSLSFLRSASDTTQQDKYNVSHGQQTHIF